MTMTLVLDFASDLANVSLPIPDAGLVLAAVAAVLLVRMVDSNRQRKAVENVSDAYVAELARSNRQRNAAEAKLARARSELERARRRSRSPARA
ncbi:hypothetical protein [Jannaschia pohangensis]|uniref:Uncharacterized protein n=1 Tax=Jannaschia pohangensis TaxID=390807 RepID=A0A1I3IXW3_9RHOB|nr:hypothetical protein [Jannaschia pohangensis]SFI52804.1 hypothetical protein SAMN04488095_1140 [Jannaschia pohangensis]